MAFLCIKVIDEFLVSLRLLEEAQLQDLEKALVLANPKASLWRKEKGLHYLQGHIVSADLSSRVTAVGGVVLPGQPPAPGEQVCWDQQECAPFPLLNPYNTEPSKLFPLDGLCVMYVSQIKFAKLLFLL